MAPHYNENPKITSSVSCQIMKPVFNILSSFTSPPFYGQSKYVYNILYFYAIKSQARLVENTAVTQRD